MSRSSSWKRGMRIWFLTAGLQINMGVILLVDVLIIALLKCRVLLLKNLRNFIPGS